jgi:diguanylate cyclase (GGDEF)-like protein/PAS domain S-box-containing protein
MKESMLKYIDKERFEYDKLSFYYLSLPIMLIGHLLGALLLSAMQVAVVDLYPVTIWLILNVLVFLYRFYHYSGFEKESEKSKLKDATIWLDRYYTDVLVSGIIWGSSAFLLFPENDLLNQAILLLFLFTIGFSSLGVLATKSDLLITYVLVMYGPVLWKFFTLGDTIYITMGYAIMALVLLMMLVANYYGRVINNSLQNKQYFLDIKASHDKLKERFFSLFERAPIGIYYYDEALKLQDVNLEFMKMNQIDDKDFIHNVVLHDVVDENKILDVHESVFDGRTGHYRGPYHLSSEQEKNLYVELSTVPMLNNSGEVAGGIAIVNDITSEVTAQEKMMRNAYYDMLTNIPNRTLLMDKLKNLIEAKKTIRTFGALIFLDIDNFKKINTTFGHDVGDRMIKQVAHIMESATGSRESIARVGGDKFVILLSNAGSSERSAKENTLQFMETLEKSFKIPINVAGKDHHLSFSSGVVLFSTTDATAFDLLKRAETAMYEAKRTMRGGMQFYKDSMINVIREQLMLENDMLRAIKEDQFEMYYQPQLNVHNNSITGAEALVRWNHPQKGMIMPNTFIPLAEESGIIIKLEEWIFDCIFQDTIKLTKELNGFPLHHLAINVSMIHFMEPRFVEKLMLLVKKHNVKPEWFELEITESSVMRNVDEAIAKINELKRFGFTFSIDDFGTGYSSLSHLKELPVDVIKIDQSFIRNMSENDEMIIEAVVAIGQKFQLKIVAEGVECDKTLNYLRDINCDVYQGFLAHSPVSLKHFKALLCFNV